jgi:flagellar FliL protein
MKVSKAMTVPVRALTAALAAVAIVTSAHAADDEEREVEIGYHAFKPSFVSNLTGGPRYIRCDIQLMTKYASGLPQIELHSPALRHTILMLIAGQDGKLLKTREGKEGLRKQALASVQEKLQELTGDTLVSDLYFTSYHVK